MIAGVRGLVLVPVVIAACSSPGAPGAGSTATPSPPSSPISEYDLGSREDLIAASQPVRFQASDGVALEGRLFGEGEAAVVLAHMGGAGDDQSDWFETASLLGDAGYVVLTYDRRGICPGGPEGCSEGEQAGDGWKDVVGAVRFLRERGIGTVVVGGASLGAMESLYAAGRAQADGLIWVAGGQYHETSDLAELAPRISGPKLYVAGRFDQDLGEVAETLHDASREPKELLLLDTGEHGTDILRFEEPPVADQLRQAILDFLEQRFG